MPSIKIPRKSTHIDMTPFVDVAFLILTFFIMATKFKAPEPVEITTPNSVSTKELPENDAIMVTMDSTGRIFFTVFSEKEPERKLEVIKNVSAAKGIELTNAEMQNYVRMHAVGVPFSQLKSLLSKTEDEQAQLTFTGIPIDSTGGELYTWIRESVNVFTGKKLNYLIKGDNEAKYPHFKNVLAAFKKNEIFKFNLVTMLEEVPKGSPLHIKREKAKAE